MVEVHWVDAVDSTNRELRDRATRDAALADRTVVATVNQTSGRGRLAREWFTPPGTCLAASILLRGVGRTGLGASWLPLIVGSAVAEALRPWVPEGVRVGVKWPNDVHARDEEQALAGSPGGKLCGVLCEALPDGAIIAGFGINLLLDEHDLPTDRATSLLALGGETGGAATLAEPDGHRLAEVILESTVSAIRDLLALAETRPSAARARVLRDSVTIGTAVRVHLPGDRIVDGRARGLDDDGALIVDLPTGGELIVNAGDIEHLR